ncbi:hypothetical protein [Pseudolysinimonas sp.]
MSYEEKYTWLFGIIAPVGYIVYLILTFTTGDGPLGETSYIWPMVGTIVGAIVVGILSGIVLGILNPKEAGKADQRDREITWFGERAGNSFVVIGGVAALILCFVQAPYAWIANVLYLGFVLSAILTTLVKLSAYHRGF